MSDSKNINNSSHSLSSISLVIPGLNSYNNTFNNLNPAEKEELKAFSFNVLNKWLSRGKLGKLTPEEREIFEHASVLDNRKTSLPYAALCLLAEQQDIFTYEQIVSGAWLRADPVYVQPDRDVVRLLAGSEVNLEQHEAEQVVELINQHFQDEPWKLHAVSPHNWYLELQQFHQLETFPHKHLIGQDITPFMPSGKDADYWLKVSNEIQMLLFGTNLNFERESRGLLPVNSLWFWGHGQVANNEIQFDAIISDNLSLIGQAKLSGKIYQDLERYLEQPQNAGSQLIFVDELIKHVMNKDIYGFLSALQVLEETLFKLLNEMLVNKQVDVVRIGFDESNVYSITKRSSGRWWKKVRPFYQVK